MPDLQRTTEGPPTPTGSASAHDTIARSFLALGTGEALARVIAFAAMLIVARRLGAEGLGVVSFSLAVLLYLARVVDAGFDLGIGVREAAARRESLGEFVPAVLAFRLVLAVAVIAIGGLAAFLFLPDPEGHIIALYSLTLVPLALSARWVLTGLDRTSMAGIARTVGELVAFLAVALALRGAADIWRVPLAQLLGDTVAAIIVVFGLRRLRVPVGVAWNSTIIGPLVVRHIAPYVGSTLLGIVVFNADVLFLRLFRDATTVGLYASAYAVVSFVLNIGGMYALTLMPALTRLASHRATRQEVYDQAAGKVFLVVLPITVGGGMIASDILGGVYGPQFRTAGAVLAVLLVSAPLSVLRSVATTAIIAERREDYLLRIVVVSAVVNVVLNIVIVPLWGMLGAAVVTGATELLRLVLAQHQATRLGYAVPSLKLGRKAIIASVVMALVLMTPAGRNPWLAVPAGAVVYGAVLVALGGLRFRRAGLPELRV
ncbi:MAG TPA: oligosaccharide flippase family protein [Gemmatimonadaceae bacterium]